MTAAYAKSGIAAVDGYARWANVATSPYQSATHGGRYVNNYADSVGAAAYSRFEEVGTMPAGSVLAKDSFAVNANGSVAIGPLFIMEKLQPGSSEATSDWRYTMILPDGSVFGTTGGANTEKVQFCADCHLSVEEDQDSLFFLPDEFRVKTQ